MRRRRVHARGAIVYTDASGISRGIQIALVIEPRWGGGGAGAFCAKPLCVYIDVMRAHPHQIYIIYNIIATVA